MTQQTYRVRFSRPEHFKAIKDFYSSDTRRTENVFLRSDAILKEQADLGRFITVWNQDERLVAASSLYVLKNGQEIECVNHGQGFIESGRVVELGSVLRAGNDPSDPAIDKGFWRLILFGLPMISALKFDLPIDILVAGVNNTDTGTRTKRYIRGEVEGSPLRYRQISPAQEFLQADSLSTGESVASGSEHFRAHVTDLIPVAQALLNVNETGYVTDMRSPSSIGYDPNMKIHVDLSELGLEDILRTICANEPFFKNSPHTLSWAEAGRQLRSRIKNFGTQHSSGPQWATSEASLPHPVRYGTGGAAAAPAA